MFKPGWASLLPVGVDFTGSVLIRKALILCSSAGVVDRLRLREWTEFGDRVDGDALRIVLARRDSREYSTGGDFGESTVTRGGKGCGGVPAAMETGLCRGGVIRLARGTDSVGASLGRGTVGDALSLPADCGRPPDTTRFPKETCRCPATGVFGVSGSFWRFSNLDKSDDTGRMDESSGPFS